MGSEEARGTTNGSTFTATGVYTMGKPIYLVIMVPLLQYQELQ